MPAAFLDILPDPNYLVTDAGFEDITGDAGPGFVTGNFANFNPSEMSRSISGKTINKTQKYATWIINMNYNPLTKAQFAPVDNFLLEKRGSRKPFYVSLPQYKLPKDTLFATFVQTSSANITTDAAETGGVTSMEITDSAWSSNNYSTTGLPSFGDLFTIYDANDSLHTKAYLVTRVETYDLYQTGNRPASGNVRIHFTPRLQRDTSSGSTLIFNNPLIRVKQSQDTHEYRLNTENLYSFSVRLKEALY